MIELQSKSQEEGAAPMNDREVCVTVLKEKSGYVRGLGPGPKPKSSAFRKTSSVELEEALRRRNEAESQARMLREEMEILKANQAEMYANQEKMVASNEQTQALIQLLMEELRSRRITQYSSSGKLSWSLSISSLCI